VSRYEARCVDGCEKALSLTMVYRSLPLGLWSPSSTPSIPFLAPDPPEPTQRTQRVREYILGAMDMHDKESKKHQTTYGLRAWIINPGFDIERAD